MVQHRIQCFNDVISAYTRDLSRDIHPLTDFNSTTRRILLPPPISEVLGLPLRAQPGQWDKAEKIVVQDANCDQQLLDLAERLVETIETVQEGLASSIWASAVPWMTFLTPWRKS